jgi:hypothetical protein
MLYVLAYFLIGYVGFITNIILWSGRACRSDFFYFFFLAWIWPVILPPLFLEYWKDGR